jgi:hypothetical protein
VKRELQGLRGGKEDSFVLNKHGLLFGMTNSGPSTFGLVFGGEGSGKSRIIGAVD